MINFFIVIFILGTLILTLTAFRIDNELKGDLVIIHLAGVGITLLGMVGIVICTVG